jgi:hypothetical protein
LPFLPLSSYISHRAPFSIEVVFVSNETSRAYVLVVIEPGKEMEFANELISKGLILDSKVERLDFVHGVYDLVVILSGNKYDIDRRILMMRKLPFVRKTQTLIPFEMLNWEDIPLKQTNKSLP